MPVDVEWLNGRHVRPSSLKAVDLDRISEARELNRVEMPGSDRDDEDGRLVARARLTGVEAPS